MASEQQWTPGFGRPYFVEPKYYKSPKLKDVNIPDDATNIPNSAHLKYNKYYSNEEVLDIWAKPLDSKDYVATPEEISRLQANPTNSAFRALLIGSTNAPCVAHLQNMFLDKCNDPGEYHTKFALLFDKISNPFRFSLHDFSYWYKEHLYASILSM